MTNLLAILVNMPKWPKWYTTGTVWMWAVYISFCICLWQESPALALGDNLSPVGQKASKHQDVAQGTKVKQELTLPLVLGINLSRGFSVLWARRTFGLFVQFKMCPLCWEQENGILECQNGKGRHGWCWSGLELLSSGLSGDVSI